MVKLNPARKNFQKKCKYFLIFSTSSKMLFLLKGSRKRKINFDICFFLETNHKSIFYNFFLRWLNGKKVLQSLLTSSSSFAKINSTKISFTIKDAINPSQLFIFLTSYVVLDYHFE